MALIGYEAQRQQLLAKMANVQKQLGCGSLTRSAEAAAAVVKPRRKLPQAARKRIAAAQEKLWAEWKAKQK